MKRGSRKYSVDHTLLRMKERYGVKCTEKDYDDLCEMVEKRLVSPGTVKEKNGGDTQFIVELIFKGHHVIAVWSKLQKCVKTVLPRR